MLSYRELMSSVLSLPVAKRLSLLETLAQSLVQDLPAKESRESSVTKVRGMLKPEGLPPSDQELEETYADLLAR